MLNKAQTTPHIISGKATLIRARMRELCTANEVPHMTDDELYALAEAARRGIEDADGKPLTSTSHPNDALIDRVRLEIGAYLVRTKQMNVSIDLVAELARVAVDHVIFEMEREPTLDADSTEQVEISLPRTFDVPPKGEMVLVIHRLDGTILVQRNRYL